MITREKLECAARDFNENKFADEFYTYHLEVLQKAQDINESVRRAVEYLFLWKLGKVASKKTPSSSQSNFSDSKGRQYYSIGKTKTLTEVIRKAIKEETLKIAIAFRNGTVTYEKFKAYTSSLASTIVLPAFYVHIWCPTKYPMIDEKVWKVFLDENGKPVFRNSKPDSWNCFEAYISFFNKIVDDTGLGRRTVDRGLWVLGDRLKGEIKSRKKGQNLPPLNNGQQEEKQNSIPIPDDVMNRAFNTIDQKVNKISFKHRGIMITRELIKVTMEILNAEPTKTLPQNCRNEVRDKTPDGLDRRIKERLNTNTRTANIISDVLEEAGIVEVIQRTGRTVKRTKLLEEWSW